MDTRTLREGYRTSFGFGIFAASLIFVGDGVAAPAPTPEFGAFSGWTDSATTIVATPEVTGVACESEDTGFGAFAEVADDEETVTAFEAVVENLCSTTSSDIDPSDGTVDYCEGVTIDQILTALFPAEQCQPDDQPSLNKIEALERIAKLFQKQGNDAKVKESLTKLAEYLTDESAKVKAAAKKSFEDLIALNAKMKKLVEAVKDGDKITADQKKILEELLK